MKVAVIVHTSQKFNQFNYAKVERSIIVYVYRNAGESYPDHGEADAGPV